MRFFTPEQFADANATNTDNTDGLTERMRNAARDCLESCSAFASSEAGQKLIAFTLVGTVLVGAGLIFGTAFETANKVGLTNNSGSILYPTWIEPYGVKDKCGAVILPGEYCTYAFNGVNSYIDIETSNGGTLHINTKCQTSLKNGPSNKKLASHGISFWTCYTDYDDTTANGENVFTNLTSAAADAYIDVTDVTPHLRGTLSSQAAYQG